MSHRSGTRIVHKVSVEIQQTRRHKFDMASFEIGNLLTHVLQQCLWTMTAIGFWKSGYSPCEGSFPRNLPYAAMQICSCKLEMRKNWFALFYHSLSHNSSLIFLLPPFNQSWAAGPGESPAHLGLEKRFPIFGQKNEYKNWVFECFLTFKLRKWPIQDFFMIEQGCADSKMWNASRFCVSSLRRGHANLLCIVPILSYETVFRPLTLRMAPIDFEHWTLTAPGLQPRKAS